jgi:hypothetical protein
MVVVLLALPVLQADDQTKKDKKPPTPKEEYQSLVKEFGNQQQEIIKEAQKLKGSEQKKLIEKYRGLGKEFADKFYKLAEENAKDAVATDALFWIVQNGDGSEVHPKALEKVIALIGDLPLKDLNARLRMVRAYNTPTLMEAVFKRAEKDEKDPLAADLLAWIGTGYGNLPIIQKAQDRLVEKYLDHAAVERICMTLSQSRSAKAEDTLKQILEKSQKSTVKAAAALGLGRKLADQADRLGDKLEEADKVAAEAEKYFVRVIDDFGKDNANQKKQAERDLKVLRTIRVGKEAPNITAPDLDEKEFKLTDYRGKVVLLDFWGHW